MPAVFDSLVHRGLTPHVGWRVSYVVPGILIVAVALGMLILGEDTPTGKWSERGNAVPHVPGVIEGVVVDAPVHGVPGVIEGVVVDAPVHGVPVQRSPASSVTEKDKGLGKDVEAGVISSTQLDEVVVA